MASAFLPDCLMFAFTSPPSRTIVDLFHFRICQDNSYRLLHAFRATFLTIVFGDQTVAPGVHPQKTASMNEQNSDSTNPHRNRQGAPLTPALPSFAPPSFAPPSFAPQQQQQPQALSHQPPWNVPNNPYMGNWAQFHANVAPQQQISAQGFDWRQQQQQQQQNWALYPQYYGYMGLPHAAQAYPIGPGGYNVPQPIAFPHVHQHFQPTANTFMPQAMSPMNHPPPQSAISQAEDSWKWKRDQRQKKKNRKEGIAALGTSQAEGPQKHKRGKKQKKNKKEDAAAPGVSQAEGPQKHKDKKIMLPRPLPSHKYLAQASEAPFVIDSPSRVLVILDLNGTLIYRPNPRKNSTQLVARPFLKPFLRYLFENFSVIVWSSAMSANVRGIVEQVLDDDLRTKLVACLARESFNLDPQHYNLNVQVYKDLDIIWGKEEIQRQVPGYEDGKSFRQHNTVLIDDSAIKACAQPFNLLLVPEFTGTQQDMNGDVLKQVAGYLELIKVQWDVSKFISKTPFVANGSWTYNLEDDDTRGGELKQKVSAKD